MGDKIEAYWDCQYCYTKGIQGRLTRCPYCGKSRGVGTEFYLKEKDNVVSDKDIEEKPDWYCSYCDTLNPYSRKDCINCGSLRNESTDNYFSLKDRKNNLNNEKIESKKTIKNWKDLIQGHELIIVIVLLVMLIFSVMVTIKLTKNIFYNDVTLDITEKSWSREIQIEEYKVVRQSDWSLPADGKLAYTKEEIYTYNQILDHYEEVTEQKSEQYISGYETIDNYVDLGNGYYENRSYQKPIYSTRYYTETYQKPVYRSEPVYKTKYYYDAERWVYVRSVTAEGNEEPYWPDSQSLKDNEREGNKIEKYFITGVDKKNQKNTYNISYDLWNQLSVGDKAKLFISGQNVQEIKSVKSQQK